jgi:hypothetical protein
MTEIILPADLAAAVASATGPVHLVDPQGRLVGVVSIPTTPTGLIHGFTEAEIAEAKERASRRGEGRSTNEVFQRLQELDRK